MSLTYCKSLPYEILSHIKSLSQNPTYSVQSVFPFLFRRKRIITALPVSRFRFRNRCYSYLLWNTIQY